MHRLLVLYPPPTDPEHFRSYYDDTHLPLVAKFPGLRGYRYSFDVAVSLIVLSCTVRAAEAVGFQT